jgi:predicted nucleic acid-binding protein
MGVILDGCIWLGLAGGVMDRRTVIAAAGEAPVFTSAISLAELRFGVEICSDPGERAIRAAWLRQVEGRPVLGVTKDTAAAFGMLAAAVRKAGRSPGPRCNDLWIAAQAIEHGYALLTINPKDFSGLPGLRLLTLQGRSTAS